MERDDPSTSPGSRQAQTLKQAISDPYGHPPPSRDSPQQPDQLESLTRLHMAARTPTPKVVSDPVLPGLPPHAIPPRRGSAVTLTDPSAPSVPSVSTASSLGRPAPLRPVATPEEVPRSEARRLRTRTLDETSQRNPTLPPRHVQRHRVGSVTQGLASPGGSGGRSSRRDSFLLHSSEHHVASPMSTIPPPPLPLASGVPPTATLDHALPPPLPPPPRDSSRGRASPRPKSAPRQDNDMPVTDPRTMLLLMTRSRGRMRGKIAFTPAPHTSWTTAWCYVDPDEGSLLCEAEPGSERHSILVPDLRGCHVTASLDARSAQPTLNLATADETIVLSLRPLNEAYFNAWFAALLCWHPLRPGQALDNISQTAPAPLGWLSDEKMPDQRINSSPRDASQRAKIIKVGRVLLVDLQRPKPLPFASPNSKLPTSRNEPRQVTPTTWSRVRIVLSEDGDFGIHSEDGMDVVARIVLSQLSRSAIQRLHPSVLDVECCFAIYPQYSRSADACSRLRPLYLAFDQPTVFEAWFVLLRAFTIPEIYGPHNALSSSAESVIVPEELPGLPRSTSPGLLRIERSLRIRIDKVKLNRLAKKLAPNQHDDEHPKTDNDDAADDSRSIREQKKRARNPLYYVQVLIDGQPKAKTTTKDGTYDPYWSETFEFFDIATTFSTMSLVLRRIEEPARDSNFTSWFHDDNEDHHGHHHNHHHHHHHHHHRDDRADDKSKGAVETCCGETLVGVVDMDHGAEVDETRPLLDDTDTAVGEVSYRLRYRQEPILMEAEYDQLSQLVLNYPNALANQISDKLPGELAPLALCFLNIFQCSDKAEEWLIALAEEEVDGILKEPPPVKKRHTQRLESNESKESLKEAIDRETAVRDLNKHATAEANLLFRGNTLASKAIDLHMKRIGRAYLESTIGPSLRHIALKELDCEVNPNRVTDKRRLQSNWRRLLKATEDIWERIYASAERCPSELRLVFRHIRACANDRYGDFLRTVTYSSVSGFLFLRFFCAAILSPGGFDLLKPDSFNSVSYEPGPKALRSYTLIAKSLQGLANMTTFGNKEPWMEPMNKFLNANRLQFKTFIDIVCDVPRNFPINTKSPSYSTPLQMHARLSGPNREGFLSLPHHIDRARSYATLVNLWLDNYNRSSQTRAVGHSGQMLGDVGRFHELCLGLRQRTNTCYERIERAERFTSSFSQDWVALAERMESVPGEFWIKSRLTQAGPHLATSSSTTPAKQHNAVPPPMLRSNSAFGSAMASAVAAAVASHGKRGASAERGSRRNSADLLPRPGRSTTYPPTTPLQPPQQQQQSYDSPGPTTPLDSSDANKLGNSLPSATPAAPLDSRPGSVGTPQENTGVMTSPTPSSRASSDGVGGGDGRPVHHYTNAERRVKDDEGPRSNSRDRSRLAGLFSRRKKFDKDSQREVPKESARPGTSDK